MKIKQVDPVILPLLVEYLDSGEYSVVTEPTPQTWRPLRASMAGTCSRRLSYRRGDYPGAQEAEAVNAESAVINFAIGNFMHEATQNAIAGNYPEAQIEVPFTVSSEITGHADAVIGDELIEIKTMGGIGHKALYGLNSWQSQPEVPKPRFLMQAALGAQALNLKQVRLVLISKEAIGASYAQRLNLSETQRWGTEWVCDDTDYLYEIAKWESERMHNVAVDPDLEPPTMPHPETGRLMQITNPATGAFTYSNGEPGKDQYWVCTYCPLQEICVSDWMNL